MQREAKTTAMSDQPIEAADLAKGTREGLSRYERKDAQLTRIQGTLEQVNTIDTRILLLLRNVPGFDQNELCSGIIERASGPVDEVLQRIGKGGPVTLVGPGTASGEGTARVRLTSVQAINERSLAEIEEMAGEPASPMSAAELVRRCHNGLERYERLGPVQTVIKGHLEDVEGASTETLHIIVNQIEGLAPKAFCIARLCHPTVAAEERLQEIGKGGEITLKGSTTADHKSLSALQMQDIQEITGCAEQPSC